MQRNIIRAVLGLTAAVTMAGLLTTPAVAATPNSTTGLTFYRGIPLRPVLNIPHPDGSCTPFPATADVLIGWSNVEQVIAYKTGDCSGTATGLGTLTSFQAGVYTTFKAH
jgi:hypothetical protein